MEAEEEKLLRMMRGWQAPDGLELEWKGEGHPDTLAKLREMEARAFAASGRIDELRREARAESNPTKDKIVSRLSEDADATAEATETAQAKPGKKRR